MGKKSSKVYIVGHKNPDTDSICSAIAYAHLKREVTGNEYVARRAGQINEETHYVLQKFKVDGGASVSDVIMQFQADISGAVLRRPMIRETTALGAAYLAGLSSGFWRDMDDLRDHWSLDKIYTPKMPEAQKKKLLSSWSHAVACAKLWREDEVE